MITEIEKLRKDLRSDRNIAFVLGNGINRYAYDGKGASWEDMLLHIYHKITKNKLNSIVWACLNISIRQHVPEISYIQTKR